MCATAPAHVRASTEVDGVGYGGQSGGAWTCGPLGVARYGGVAARVHLAEKEGRLGGSRGVGEIAVAGEYENTKILDCYGSAACQAPPARVLAGGHARVGYQGEIGAIEIGATAFQGWGKNTDTRPRFAVVPDLELRFGPAETWRGVVGFGSPLVTLLRRPGAYCGLDGAVGALDVEFRLGAYRAGPALFDDMSARGDLATFIPVWRHVSVRLGAALSNDAVGVAGEGSFGVRGAM